MIENRRVIVVMPAYNAEKTLKKTVAEIDRNFVDEIVLVDDCSSDRTLEVASELGLQVVQHASNLGYGGNQKTCYRTALERGADIVVMLHPDYQYTPKLIVSMINLIATGVFDVVLGSRILSGKALEGGMPYYKYVANRLLTLVQNMGLGAKLSEYHTGYRAYSRQVLETLPLEANDNDFVFDNQFLVQSVWAKFRIGEISCPAKYFEEASSINFSRSVKYGLGCLWNTLAFVAAKSGLYTVSWLQFGRSRSPKLVEAAG